MRNLVIALVLASSLTACGGAGGPAAAPHTTTATAKPSPTPSVVKVGDAAICTLLVDRKDAPFTRSVDLMRKDYADGDDVAAAEVATELDDIAARAESATLSQNVEVLAQELRAIFDGSKTDTTDFVASATEVNNLCGATARF